MYVEGSAKILTNVQTFRDCALHSGMVVTQYSTLTFGSWFLVLLLFQCDLNFYICAATPNSILLLRYNASIGTFCTRKVRKHIFPFGKQEQLTLCWLSLFSFPLRLCDKLHKRSLVCPTKNVASHVYFLGCSFQAILFFHQLVCQKHFRDRLHGTSTYLVSSVTKVWIRAKWHLRLELFSVSVAWSD